jgi:glutathione-specific gamma-glutamylcyclotransferase
MTDESFEPLDPDNRPPPCGGKDLWLFAYGSLLWNPGFYYEERRPGLLRGYHRAFCVYSHRYRGTPEKPGLVLGLDRGGQCRGIAYRVHCDKADEVMQYLWEREMTNQTYQCRELKVETDAGEVVCRTFVVDRRHKQYTGKLALAKQVELICQGQGQRGAARAYLENTVRHLDELGIPDQRLHDLLEAVRAAAPVPA